VKRILVGFILAALAGAVTADEYVRPYIQKEGTLVQGYWRSEANRYRFDNYSAQGGTMPYISEQGYERHEFSSPPVYPNLYRKEWGGKR
jgi:hypothetical protein